MKLIIAGGRNFTNYQKLKKTCDLFIQDQTDIEIISGAYYRGADELGELYAKQHGYKLTRFPANWEKYGKAAGPKRNEQMANYADTLIAFWDEKSRGTKNMIDLAKSNHLKVSVCYY